MNKELTDEVLKDKYGYVPKEDEQWIVWRGYLIVAHPNRLPRMYHISHAGTPHCKVLTP